LNQIKSNNETEIETLKKSVVSENGTPVDFQAIVTDYDEIKETSDELTAKNQTLQEEVNRLYNLTEKTPSFQIYWHLRDVYPAWASIKQIANLIGMPSVRIIKELKNYYERGLVELDGDKARYQAVIKKPEEKKSK